MDCPTTGLLRSDCCSNWRVAGLTATDRRGPECSASDMVNSLSFVAWHDARLREKVTAQQELLRIALPAATSTAAMAGQAATVATARRRRTPLLRRIRLEAAEAVQVAAQGRSGLGPVRPFRIHQRKYRNSRLFGKPSKGKHRFNRTFETPSCATLGATVRVLRRNCTTSWRQQASRFGSARRTSFSACQ